MEFNGEYLTALCRSQEKNLISNDKFDKILSQDFSGAMKSLAEFGFGKGETHSFECMISNEEIALIDFIKKFAPQNLSAFLLLDYDYFNVESAIRAFYLNLPLDAMLKCEGIYSLKSINKLVESGIGDFSPFIKSAVAQAKKLFEDKKATGVLINDIFTKYKFKQKLSLVKNNADLLDIVLTEIDCLNISLALRAEDETVVKNSFIDGGTLTINQAISLFDGAKKGVNTVKNVKYAKYTDSAIASVKGGQALTLFENFYNGYALKKFKENRFTAQGITEFLLYVFYKFNEIKNVRTVMVGISSNADTAQIKLRMRENYAG